MKCARNCIGLCRREGERERVSWKKRRQARLVRGRERETEKLVGYSLAGAKHCVLAALTMPSLSHRLSHRLYLSHWLFVVLYLHCCLALINVNNLLHLSRAFVWVVVAPLPLPLPTSFALFYGILVRNSLIALLWLFEKQTELSRHGVSTEFSISV